VKLWGTKVGKKVKRNAKTAIPGSSLSHAKILRGFISMIGQHLVQISSNSATVKLDPYLELTQNGPICK